MIASGAGFTSSVMLADPGALFPESETRTVNVYVPADPGGGVPVKKPDELRLSQKGKPVADQLYGGNPPLARNCWPIPTPTVPGPTDGLAIETGTSWKFAVTLVGPLNVTVVNTEVKFATGPVQDVKTKPGAGIACKGIPTPAG